MKHLIGSAVGGNPERDALYLPITPARNDGSTIHKLTVGDVPVNGFWSLTVYDSKGYIQPDPGNAHSVSSITMKKGQDGLATIQFGNCDGTAPNCLPITQGWNYTVRLFLPRGEILDGSWTISDGATREVNTGFAEALQSILWIDIVAGVADLVARDSTRYRYRTASKI